jgi:phosphonoacetate hydrolase
MSVIQVSFIANGRKYSPPARPIVIICLDGSADEYLDAAMARGLMPNLQRMAVEGFRGLARAAMPTFTNVNNSSIITGVPPSAHGIGGNFFLNPDTGEEVMMNSSAFLRAETITGAAHRAGRKVGIVTAKEKLRDILGAGLNEGARRGIAFSSEKVDQARVETHGIEGTTLRAGVARPNIYSGDASLFVLEAGLDLLKQGKIDFAYLSTTDFIQHKYAPEDAEALKFYRRIDEIVGELVKTGALVGITADHGMNAKQRADGSPNVVYLDGLLRDKFGPGFRVVLPITDPYVLHHGALGSFAVIHTPAGADLRRVAGALILVDGITEVMDRATAAVKLELPNDRLGELVVISGRNVVLGMSPEKHDLRAVATGLRSHGGRYEEMVPFFFSAPLNREYAQRARGDVRNFDVFDFVCNGLQS